MNLDAMNALTEIAKSKPGNDRTLCAVFAFLFFASLVPGAPAKADPPPWAPAHGWRAKHHRGDDDDEGPRRVYVMPYGLSERTCHRDLIGAAIGGAAGGLAGSQIGRGNGRTAATIGGVVIGALVGGAVGRAMDDVDQACVGQVLEHVPDRERIGWRGHESGYAVVPTRTYQNAGRYCREYQTEATVGGRVQSVYGTACRQSDGSWQIVN
jgi:surface antigen